jgi:hypothetical protein
MPALAILLLATLAASDATSAASATSSAPATRPVDSPVKYIYVLPMSHLDIGFTDVPSAVAAKMVTMTDEVLDQAAKDPAYVWDFETFWQLDQWLRKKPPAEREKQLVDLVRAGRIGIGAAYHTPHTAVMSEWMLDRLCEPAQMWANRSGLKLEAAVLDDMPGHPPDLPRALSRAGIKYLVIGINTSLSDPLAAKYCDTPFWWEAPTGERVLTWISSRAYTGAFLEMGFAPDIARFFAHDKFPGDDMSNMRKGIGRVTAQYVARGYAHDAFLELHAFDNWGAGSSKGLPRFARMWNDAGEGPKIRIATPEQFFEHILQSGVTLPVYRGGFGGYWDRNRISIPLAVRRMRAAEEAFQRQMLDSRKPFDCARPEVIALLTLYDHTFPFATGWPDMLDEQQIARHNREQADLLGQLPDNTSPQQKARGWSWPVRGKPTPLRVVGDGKLSPNGLYLAEGSLTGQFAGGELKPLGRDAWLESASPTRQGGIWQFRHRIDRVHVPHMKPVVWAWPLKASGGPLKIQVQTATGWMRVPQDFLDASQFHGNWFSPWATRVSGAALAGSGVLWQKAPESVEIAADVPLAFCMSEKHPGWLFAMCFFQGTESVLKGNVKKTMPLDEIYPTEERELEFAIELRAAVGTRPAD